MRTKLRLEGIETNRITVVIIAILTVSSAVAVGLVTNSDSPSAVEVVEKRDVNVLILGDGASADSLYEEFDFFAKSVSRAESIQDLESEIGSGSVRCVVIPDTWVSENSDYAPILVHELYDKGQIVMVHGGMLEWEKAGLTCAYSEEDVFTAVMRSDGVERTYGVVCESLHDAVDRATAWASGSIPEYMQNEHDFGSEIDAYLDFESSGYGWTTARTEYYKEADVSESYDYYTGDYIVHMDPNAGSYCSGLDVASETSGGYLMKYGPSTTPINYVYTVSVSATISETPGITVGNSWQYTVYDTSYDDQTSIIDNKLDIRTNINEASPTGAGTCGIEPGKLVKINDGSTYYGHDTYKAQFCHHYFFGFGAYNDTASGRNVIIIP